MQIYNTLSRKKEPFLTADPKKARIYVCGPTVYNYIHIGNARPICVFDVLRRYLTYTGVEVTYVQNYTDVNDKIIAQASKEGIAPEECAKKYIAEYEADANGLGVLPPSIQPKVTESIPQILDFIGTLVEKGYAYPSQGDVYYRTRKCKGYGKLSGQSLDDVVAGARVEVNDSKEDPLDFALWKGATIEEQHWNSPWGTGRPGWHIECSVMAKHTLGDTIDLHCGGTDLIFPHHENEIAQSEACNDCTFARYWMHNGHINVDHKKMSKSLGNFFLVRDVAKQYGYEVIRYLMIQAQYRAPMNYTADLLEACKASLDRLYECRETLKRAITIAPEGETTTEAGETFDRAKTCFCTALDDDLNTADALTAVFELVRSLNSMAGDPSTPKVQLCAGLNLFEELCTVLGLLYERKEESAIPQEVLDLAEARTVAKRAKDFAKADAIRDQIQAIGYAIRDTRQGVEIKPL